MLDKVLQLLLEHREKIKSKIRADVEKTLKGARRPRNILKNCHLTISERLNEGKKYLKPAFRGVALF